MQLRFSNNTDAKRLNQISNKAHFREKQPSKLGILILFFITITLYSFGIYELNKAVVNIIEAAVEQTTIDY